jgi:hypothetical protein
VKIIKERLLSNYGRQGQQRIASGFFFYRIENLKKKKKDQNKINFFSFLDN